MGDAGHFFYQSTNFSDPDNRRGHSPSKDAGWLSFLTAAMPLMGKPKTGTPV